MKLWWKSMIRFDLAALLILLLICSQQVWLFCWPLAKAAGLLSISLGGLGVRDATLMGLLVPFGVPAAQGLAVSLIWESVLIGGGLMGGWVWWLLSHGGAQRALPGQVASSGGLHE